MKKHSSDNIAPPSSPDSNNPPYSELAGANSPQDPSGSELLKSDKAITAMSAQLRRLIEANMSNSEGKEQTDPTLKLLEHGRHFAANSTSQVLEKLEALTPLVETSSLHWRELSDIVRNQPIMMLDSLDSELTIEDKLLQGLHTQRQTLDTLQEVHRDIQTLHALQGLVSQVAVKTVNAADQIKHDRHETKAVLESLHDLENSTKTVNHSPASKSQHAEGNDPQHLPARPTDNVSGSTSAPAKT